MKQRFSYGLSLFAILAILAACGGSANNEPAPAPATAVAEPTAAANTSDSSESSEESEPSNAESAAEEELADSAIKALDELNSYASEMNLTVEGLNDAGEKVKYEYFMRQEFVRDPLVRNVLIDFVSTDSESQSGTLAMYESDGRMYLQTNNDQQQQCFSGEQSDGSAFDGMITPSELLANVNDTTLVESGVLVNGIKSDHYKSEQRGNEAEIWLAANGGYLVKFTGSGNENFMGDQELTDTKYTWTYDLLDVNNLKPSPIPAECADAGMADDVPVLDDASQTNFFGGAMVYTSQTSVADAKAFYEAELAAAGWTLADGMDVDGTAHLQATKDARTLTVMISPEEGKTSIMLVETEQ